jgi:hypothetical protein
MLSKKPLFAVITYSWTPFSTHWLVLRRLMLNWNVKLPTHWHTAGFPVFTLLLADGVDYTFCGHLRLLISSRT